jgi:NTE family protein
MGYGDRVATQREGLPIGVVLSGGGGRCIAQIGALQALEEAGFRVAAVAGNSTAAVVGALYAACCDARAVEAIVRSTDLSALLQPDGSSGLFGHDGIERLLEAHAPPTFEELLIPLAVPTVDIERAELLVFRKGPLGPPVCASNAFPGLFVPVRYRGRQLMDGGIIDNFPVDLIGTLTDAPAVAIDVRPPASGSLDLETTTRRTLLGKVASLFSQGLPHTFDILMRAYSITQSRLIEVTCALHPPRAWLRPALPDDMEVQDFSRIDEALGAGRRSVEESVASGALGELLRGDDR